MPLEKNNLMNDNDPETRLENDNSRDLNLTEDASASNNEQLNCGRDMRVVSDGENLADGIIELAHKEEYIDEP